MLLLFLDEVLNDVWLFGIKIFWFHLVALNLDQLWTILGHLPLDIWSSPRDKLRKLEKIKHDSLRLLRNVFDGDFIYWEKLRHCIFKGTRSDSDESSEAGNYWNSRVSTLALYVRAIGRLGVIRHTETEGLLKMIEVYY